MAMAPEPDPTDLAARTALARAAAGQLLSPSDMQAIWHLSASRWCRLRRQHVFDRFLTKNPIGRHCYSGVLVHRHVQGEPEYIPSFGQKRAR